MSDTLGIEKAVSSITAAAGELQEGLADVRKFKSAAKRLEENAEANAQLVTRLEAALGHMSGAASSLDSAAADLSEKGIGRFEKALDAGLDEVRESSRRTKTEVQAIEASLTKEMGFIGERFSKLGASVLDIQPSLEKCVEGIEASRKEAAASLQTAISLMNEKMDAQKSLVETLARDAQNERQAAELVAAGQRKIAVVFAILLLAMQAVIVYRLLR